MAVFVQDHMKTWVVRLHWIISIHRDNMDKRAVYYHLVESEVSICCDVKDLSLFEISPRDIYEANYTLRSTRI